jgi:hypothetical protein
LSKDAVAGDEHDAVAVGVDVDFLGVGGEDGEGEEGEEVEEEDLDACHGVI